MSLPAAALARFRLPVRMFAVFLALQAGTGAALSLTRRSSAEAAGSWAQPPPEAVRSLEGTLEVTLPHLLAIPLTLFAAAHLALLAWPRRSLRVLVRLGMGFALPFLLGPLLFRTPPDGVKLFLLAGLVGVLGGWVLLLFLSWRRPEPPT